ncbi:hypothetical protein JYT74_03695 [Crocinitomix catalasitica]|nr:hypothetical protein [Crocinitomix catalasitica]
MEHSDNEDPKVNLKPFKRHQRSLPWQFVVKIIMGIAIIAVLYFFSQMLMNSEPEDSAESDNGIEVEIE